MSTKILAGNLRTAASSKSKGLLVAAIINMFYYCIPTTPSTYTRNSVFNLFVA